MMNLMFDGGPWMYLVLLLGLFTVPIAGIVPLGLGLAKLRAPASLGWLPLMAVAAAGLIGTLQSAYQLVDALVMASPELQGVLRLAGHSYALYPLAFALLIVAAGMASSALATSLAALVAPGPDATVDAPGLGASAAGALLGGALGTLGAFVLAGPTGLLDAGPLVWVALAVSGLTSAAAVLASARVSEAPEHRGRSAAQRAFIGLGGLLAVIGLTEVAFTLGQSALLTATANAALDQADAMRREGEAVVWAARLAGLPFAFAPLFAGLAGAAPQLKHLTSREALGGALAGGQAVALLGAYGLTLAWVNGLLAPPT